MSRKRHKPVSTLPRCQWSETKIGQYNEDQLYDVHGRHLKQRRLRSFVNKNVGAGYSPIISIPDWDRSCSGHRSQSETWMTPIALCQNCGVLSSRRGLQLVQFTILTGRWRHHHFRVFPGFKTRRSAMIKPAAMSSQWETRKNMVCLWPHCNRLRCASIWTYVHQW